MLSKIRKATLLFAIVAVLLSCKKDNEDVAPKVTSSDEFTSESYYPLNTGNTWKYEGPELNYTITVTGKDIINNVEYSTLLSDYEDDLTPNQTSQMRYQDGKYYSIVKLNANGTAVEVEFLILNERANAGDKWKMGQITQQSQGFSFTTDYDVEVIGKYNTKEINGKSYNDVFELFTITSISYNFSQELIDQYALIGYTEADLIDLFGADQTFSTQTTFYAKGVGLISQTSESFDDLAIDLKSYSLQ